MKKNLNHKENNINQIIEKTEIMNLTTEQMIEVIILETEIIILKIEITTVIKIEIILETEIIIMVDLIKTEEMDLIKIMTELILIDQDLIKITDLVEKDH